MAFGMANVQCNIKAATPYACCIIVICKPGLLTPNFFIFMTTLGQKGSYKELSTAPKNKNCDK